MYSQGIYRSERCAVYWFSLGVLYFRACQFSDSRMAILQSWKWNRLLWRLYYNLRVLVQLSPFSPPTSNRESTMELVVLGLS
ncbi:uncharacterized protein BDV17DRAFT_275151 [Aspergillus undulatus]|uniref:uncharacterized protein n=1 Tax=Aspergillus undulatus TaxID=1810928 RepID=UPI003CCD6262